MSTWYFISRRALDDVGSFPPKSLSIALIKSTYTPNELDLLADIVTHEADYTGYQRYTLTSKVETLTSDLRQITYSTSNQFYWTLSGGTGEPNYILVIDDSTGYPLFLLDSNTIEITGVTIKLTMTDLATQDVPYDRADWVRINTLDIVTTDSGTDFDAITTQAVIDEWVDRLDQIGEVAFIPNTLGKSGTVYAIDTSPQLYITWWVNAYDNYASAVTADAGTEYSSSIRNRFYIDRELLKYTSLYFPNTAGKSAVVYGTNPRSQFYNDFVALVTGDSGTMYDTQGIYSDLSLNSDMFEKTGWFMLNVAGKSGVVYGFEYPIQSQTVDTATLSYDVTDTVTFPNLIVTRASDGLSATIDCDNLPTGYEIKLFRGTLLRGTKISTTELIDLGAIDLPYTDSGLTAVNNYKYYGKFTATGDINGTPTTVTGRQGSSRITVPSTAPIP